MIRDQQPNEAAEGRPSAPAGSPGLARPSLPFWSFSTWLMLVLLASFAMQQFVIVYKGKPYETYFALNAYGMKSWYVWELFTFQFLHSNVIHLLVNLAGLWCLGRTVEAALGRKNFLFILIGTGLAGGVLQGVLAMLANFLPESLDQFRNATAGSSAGLCGMLAVWCRLQPDARFRFGINLPVKGRHLLWLTLVVTIILAAIPFGANQLPDLDTNLWKGIWWAPINLAHAAHVGALLGGMLFVKLGLHDKFAPAAAKIIHG